MTNKLIHVSPIEEIEHRYKCLYQSVQRRLTDHYNHWLGLHLVAYGDDWQRERMLWKELTVELKRDVQLFLKHQQ